MLFSGGSDLQDRVVAAIASAPADRAAYDVVVEGMAAGGEALEERRDYARQRAAAIAANPSLQERELLKLSALSAAAATALAERGLPAPVAALVAGGLQFGDDGRADPARCAGDEDPHDFLHGADVSV